MKLRFALVASLVLASCSGDGVSSQSSTTVQLGDHSAGPSLDQLDEPMVNRRSDAPVLHRVLEGTSPWDLAADPDMRNRFSTMTWTITAYDHAEPASNGSASVDVPVSVDISGVTPGGAHESLGTFPVVLRAEFDEQALLDQFNSGASWAMPLGYTVYIQL